MAKKRKEVTFGLSDHPLARDPAGVKFQVDDNQIGKLGELHVSQGSVRWKKYYGQKRFVLSWDEFDKMMQAHGRKES